MDKNQGLMPPTSQAAENYNEVWKVVLQNGSEYKLAQEQADKIKKAISMGSRGIIMFESFSISIPYIIEFYRLSRRLKVSSGLKQIINLIPQKYGRP